MGFLGKLFGSREKVIPEHIDTLEGFRARVIATEFPERGGEGA
jgi:hypothetical protein